MRSYSYSNGETTFGSNKSCSTMWLQRWLPLDALPHCLRASQSRICSCKMSQPSLHFVRPSPPCHTGKPLRRSWYMGSGNKAVCNFSVRQYSSPRPHFHSSQFLRKVYFLCMQRRLTCEETASPSRMRRSYRSHPRGLHEAAYRLGPARRNHRADRLWPAQLLSWQPDIATKT